MSKNLCLSSCFNIKDVYWISNMYCEILLLLESSVHVQGTIKPQETVFNPLNASVAPILKPVN